MNLTDHQIIKRLAATRRARKMSQTALAADLGVSRNTIVNWETGRRDPLPAMMFALREWMAEV